jgi:hypothetical protein
VVRDVNVEGVEFHSGASERAGIESIQAAIDAEGLLIQVSPCNYTGEWEVVCVFTLNDKEKKRQCVRKRSSRFKLRRLLIPNLVLPILRLLPSCLPCNYRVDN